MFYSYILCMDRHKKRVLDIGKVISYNKAAWECEAACLYGTGSGGQKERIALLEHSLPASSMNWDRPSQAGADRPDIRGHYGGCVGAANPF